MSTQQDSVEKKTLKRMHYSQDAQYILGIFIPFHLYFVSFFLDERYNKIARKSTQSEREEKEGIFIYIGRVLTLLFTYLLYRFSK